MLEVIRMEHIGKCQKIPFEAADGNIWSLFIPRLRETKDFHLW